jgi:hypothetical protein
VRISIGMSADVFVRGSVFGMEYRERYSARCDNRNMYALEEGRDTSRRVVYKRVSLEIDA